MKVWPTRAPHTWRAWVLFLCLILSQCASFRQADGSEASGILFPELSTPLPSPKVKLCHHSEQLWKCNRSKPSICQHFWQQGKQWWVTLQTFQISVAQKTLNWLLPVTSWQLVTLEKLLGYIWLKYFEPKLVFPQHFHKSSPCELQ